MLTNEFKQDFIDYMKSNLKVCNIVAGSRELVVRCPYCGDSTKSDYHAHLYISLTHENCFPYYCQKCMASGVVDKTLLKDLKINNYNLINAIEEINKKARIDNKHFKKNINSSFSLKKVINRTDLIIPEFNNTKASVNKLKYINSRFSFNLDPEEYINKYKVVFSIKDFLEQNEIEFVNCSEYMFPHLVKNYIGFLSADSKMIIFRNILPTCEKKYRYYNYNIFDDMNSSKFYLSSSTVDLLNPTIDLITCEGIFDLIGIREYFYKDCNDKIFTAVCGKGYNLVVNHFARLGFINMNINIYSDADVNINKYKNMRKYCEVMLNNNVKIFYNSLDKDYGIPKENIKLREVKL